MPVRKCEIIMFEQRDLNIYLEFLKAVLLFHRVVCKHLKWLRKNEVNGRCENKVTITLWWPTPNSWGRR